MKIAVIHLSFTLESGNPRLALSLAQAYKSLGHDVLVYTTEFDPNCFPRLNRGLDIRVVDSAGRFSSATGGAGFLSKVYKRMRKVIIGRRIARAIAAELPADIDLLDCQNDDSYKTGLYYKKINPDAKVAWVMYNPPFYHFTKDNFIFDIGSRIFAWWEHRAVRKYSKGIDLVVTDDKEKEEPFKKLGLSTMLMPIPVDFDNFYAPVKKEIGNSQPIVLLGAGGLSITRRFEDIISAVAILRKQGYDARATIICKDYWADANYRKQFDQFIEESGAGEYIDAHFNGAGEDEFVEILKSSSIFVFPNNVKIWGMTIFEAMAAGLPVIVSRATSAADFLHDGENALLVNPLHPEEIAEKVKKLSEDREFSRRLAESGQNYVKDNLSWKKYAQEIINFRQNKTK